MKMCHSLLSWAQETVRAFLKLFHWELEFPGVFIQFVCIEHPTKALLTSLLSGTELFKDPIP